MSQVNSYWSRTAEGYRNRRWFLKASASLSAAGLGAAALAACGGSSGKTTNGGQGLVSQPSDTTSKATKGGLLELSRADPNSLDFTAGSQAPDFSGLFYSRLMRYDSIKYPMPALAVVVPDAAVSWETSPDGMTYTYKLRQGFRFDSRSPTNGRALTSADVIYSWNRFATRSSFRNTMVNSVDPSAPVLSLTAPDDQTVVARLAFPYSPFNVMLGYYRYGQIMPTEADSGFDVRQDARGTGVWRLKSYTPSQRFEVERNPNWYEADKVYLDGMAFNVLPEYAAALAQFRAGRLATYAVLPQDVLATKRSVPNLAMLADDQFPVAASWIRFSYLPNSPFLDERVRKALSMLLDRDLYIKTFGNVEEFEKEGVPVPTRWNSPIACGEEGYWLDPKDEKALGPGAKFFQFDPAEAKKLLNAAGYTKPVESKLTFSNSGTEGQRQAEVMRGMWEANGDFRITSQVVDFVTEFRPNYSQASDKHEGIAYSGASGYPDIDGWLWIYYKSGSERSGHLDGGKVDSVLDDMIVKQRLELDPQKRIALVKDIQRHLANKMYMLNDPGKANGFLLAWSWLGNFGEFRSRVESLPAVEGWTKYWIDQTKQA